MAGCTSVMVRRGPKKAKPTALLDLDVHFGTGALALDLRPERHAYLVASKGRIAVNGVAVGPRDGVAITGESRVEISASEDAEIVLVDSE